MEMSWRRCGGGDDDMRGEDVGREYVRKSDMSEVGYEKRYCGKSSLAIFLEEKNLKDHDLKLQLKRSLEISVS